MEEEGVGRAILNKFHWRKATVRDNGSFSLAELQGWLISCRRCRVHLSLLGPGLHDSCCDWLGVVPWERCLRPPSCFKLTRLPLLVFSFATWSQMPTKVSLLSSHRNWEIELPSPLMSSFQRAGSWVLWERHSWGWSAPGAWGGG